MKPLSDVIPIAGVSDASRFQYEADIGTIIPKGSANKQGKYGKTPSPLPITPLGLPRKAEPSPVQTSEEKSNLLDFAKKHWLIILLVAGFVIFVWKTK